MTPTIKQGLDEVIRVSNGGEEADTTPDHFQTPDTNDTMDVIDVKLSD
jgi:hypothetical protein